MNKNIDTQNMFGSIWDFPDNIMEAMKMEYTIKAHCAGEVTDVFFASGDLVSDGDELVAIAEKE